MRGTQVARLFASVSLSALLAGSVFGSAGAQDVHLKDIAHVQGVTANQLVGYGLVTGLAGTGDSTAFTNKTMQNFLQSFGLSTATNDVKTKNVAAVVVTASLPAFAHSGDNIASPCRRWAMRRACKAERSCSASSRAPTI